MEKGSNSDIRALADSFGVEFPLVQKVNINGRFTHDAFKYIRIKSSLYDPKKKLAS